MIFKLNAQSNLWRLVVHLREYGTGILEVGSESRNWQELLF